MCDVPTSQQLMSLSYVLMVVHESITSGLGVRHDFPPQQGKLQPTLLV